MTISPQIPAARQIAEFATGLRLDDVPQRVRERARLHILDALGLAFASTVQDYARTTIAGTSALAGSGDCRVIGDAARLPLRDAALVNAVLIHGLDFDET